MIMFSNTPKCFKKNIFLDFNHEQCLILSLLLLLAPPICIIFDEFSWNIFIPALFALKQ